MRRTSLLWCLSLASTLTATAASGFVEPQGSTELAKQTAVPVGIRVLRPDLAPARTEALTTGAAEIRYDARSGAARVISGRLLDAPAVEGVQTADAFVQLAERFLAEKADLIGVAAGDLALNRDAVLLDDDVQFLKFNVNRDGLLVEDATLDFRFKKGALLQVANKTYSEATSDLRTSQTGLDRVAAEQLMATSAEPQGERYRVVQTKAGYQLVRVAQFGVRGQDGALWIVQIEAATGGVFEVRPTTFHLSGSAQGDVYPRWYTQPLEQRGYPFLTLPYAGGSLTTNAAGNFTGAPDGVSPKLDGYTGTFVKLGLMSGTKVTRDGARVRDEWHVRYTKTGTDPVHDDKNVAQSMVFFHTNDVVRYAKGYIATPWLERQLTANVNLTQTCNAHWDGSTINFYSGGGGCANTGLISDVVFHEWGHGLDANTGGIADGAYSEGFGDIMSLMMTQSSVLGIGFRTDGSPVRDLGPDKIYPRDQGGGVHSEGLIIGSTFFDLYTALVEAHGRDRAVDLLSKYALKTIFTASNYTDVYDALLVVDDDDGDLANGTPNSCLANRVFAAHGLATADEACNLASVDLFEVDDRAGGNGNGVIEPGEAINLWLTARNAGGADLNGLAGDLTVTGAAGVTVSQGALSWTTVPARSTRRSTDAAQVDVARSVACGTKFTAKVALRADSRTATVTKDLTVGRLAGTAQAFNAAGLPAPIADNQTTTANLAVDGAQWGATTTVHEARLKFDVTHTYVGDLTVKLVAPDGTTKEIMKGNGAADDIHFDEDVSAHIAGLKGKGTWKLLVTDGAAQDTGTLDTARLTVTPAHFECN